MSTSCVFQLKGSQAHIRLLRPKFDESLFHLRDFLEVNMYFIRKLMFWRMPDNTNLDYFQEHIGNAVPFYDRTQQLLWDLLKRSLDIQDLDQYARGHVSPAMLLLAGNSQNIAGPQVQVCGRSQTPSVAEYDSSYRSSSNLSQPFGLEWQLPR